LKSEYIFRIFDLVEINTILEYFVHLNLCTVDPKKVCNTKMAVRISILFKDSPMNMKHSNCAV